MNRRSKRFTPSAASRWLVPGLLMLLTVVLVGTMILLIYSLSGL